MSAAPPSPLEDTLAEEGGHQIVVYDDETMTYRYLPKKAFNPTPAYVWGNNVAFLIWEPLTLIRIQNKELANSFNQYFEILWKSASKKPKRKIEKKKI